MFCFLFRIKINNRFLFIIDLGIYLFLNNIHKWVIIILLYYNNNTNNNNIFLFYRILWECGLENVDLFVAVEVYSQ